MPGLDLRTTAALAREGWSSRMIAAALERGDLVKVGRGMYSGTRLEGVQLHRHRAVAAALTRRGGPVVSHLSAAALHGLPVRAQSLGTVHLSQATGGHGRLAHRVHVHQAAVPAEHTVVIDGVRVTSLERTVADLARVEPYEWGVVAADAALARKASPLTLAEHLADGRGRAGNGRLRQVLAFADSRSGSAAESMSRVSMARAGLPAPELQFEVIAPGVGWVATSDFGWPAHRVVGEMDGRAKYEHPDRGRSTVDVVLDEKKREEGIRQCRWWLCRWGWEVATNHVKLGQRLREAFRWRA